MKNILIISYYELKKLFRNYRLLILVLSQPIVIALLIGLMANRYPTDIKVGLINNSQNKYSQELVDDLKTSDKLQVTQYEKIDDNLIKEGKLRSFIVLGIKGEDVSDNNITILTDPTSGVIEPVIQAEVAEAAAKISQKMAEQSVNLKINQQLQSIKNYLPLIYRQNLNQIKIDLNQINNLEIVRRSATPFSLKYVDYYASAMMVLLAVLVILNLSGISITTERISGTFERLFVTPYSKLQVILGKALTQFFIGIFVIFIGTLSVYLMFGITIGSIWLVILIDVLVVMTAVALGLFISSITYTVVESVELAMYIFFVSVLTSGIVSPKEVHFPLYNYFIKIIPFSYAVDASRRVNMAGAEWPHIANNIYILLAFFIVFMLLSAILLRREAR